MSACLLTILAAGLWLGPGPLVPGREEGSVTISAEVLLVEDDPADAELMFTALREVFEFTRIARARDGAERWISWPAGGRSPNGRRTRRPGSSCWISSSQLQAPYSDMVEVARPIRGHHERWDGAGYPDRRARQDIAWGETGCALPLRLTTR